jgi:DNA-binding response OmpR family regulator
MAKILLVDDDTELTETLDEWLTEQGHAIDTAANGGDGLGLLDRFPYDAIVLDWQMPDMTGIQFLTEYRSSGGATPIVILTAKAALEDKETGFGAGADDYLTKPFHPRELSARLKALLRRPPVVARSVLQVGDLTLDMGNCTVHRAGREIHFSKKELALLELMMRNTGQVFSADALIDRLWASEKEASPDTVRVHIKRMREKIDCPGCTPLLHTVHRMGYKIEDRP